MKFTMVSTSLKCAAALVLCGAMAGFASAGTIGLGHVVVVQDGADGAGSGLAATGTAAFVKEYDATTANQAAPIQTIALPTNTAGSGSTPNALVLSGTATSEGFITLSANRKYLTVAGYNAAPAATVVGSATIARTAGRIDVATGGIDTTTQLVANAADGNTGNPRSITSNDGNEFWVGTSAGGVRYQTFGTSSGSTQISAAPTNTRVVNIDAGQLYVSSSSGAFLGVSTIGSGLPTTSGQTTTALPGFPTTGSHSSYDYLFANSTTLYVADDGAVANGGGIQKWSLVSGTWTLDYNLLNNGTTTTSVRGLAASNDGTTVRLFATTTTNTLITLSDTIATIANPGVAATTVLATAPANTAFRGVEYVVPEPATIALATLGGLGLLGLIRRRK